ncbi:hypothetical protein AJ85_13970 [Alkalihalobacillus alcalophilus ATCC 27647 = CGMCC 1.3604]|uniref:Uncharacterized protein n=1 Tax=Alkalihalobacillus alcalophilus ATCC 27647 = CGMCC 1.3604 TaxID=1218173 RepID=A0A4S4JZV9_ALKAL|nr:hypothetical protein AJ85_13970 [Alkalihalobacillus alcalophilus ATCC 27647 = CGMCC 1.3604]
MSSALFIFLLFDTTTDTSFKKNILLEFYHKVITKMKRFIMLEEKLVGGSRPKRGMATKKDLLNNVKK